MLEFGDNVEFNLSENKNVKFNLKLGKIDTH